MMRESLSPRRQCQAIRNRSNREGPLRLGRFIRACESQRKYTDLPRVKLSEEIQKCDSTTILVDSEFFLSQMEWDMKDEFSAESDFLRFVAQFKGADVTFAMGSKGEGDDSVSSCDGGDEEPGALSYRETPEVTKTNKGASLTAGVEKLSDDFDGLTISHATMPVGAQGIGSVVNLRQGIAHLKRPSPQRVEKPKSSKNKVPVETSTSGPGTPERIIMSPPRPLDAFELKSQSDLNSGAHDRDKSRACDKLFSPEGSRCILLEPQIVKSPAKVVQPGSQGLDLADEDFELDSLEPNELSPRSIPATRSFFVETAKKHNYGIIQIDEEPGNVGETAAYTRQVALAAQSQAFTYAVVGGSDFLCFNFRDTYDIRFTDVNPYGLAFEETTPFRAESIAKTLELTFNGLILFTCLLGNRFCHQSRRIFYDLSSGRNRRGSLSQDEHEQAKKALEEIRKFENNDDYHTLFEYVSFGVGLTGHSQMSIEASFAYYSLRSSQENMDWNHLAANKSEATKIMDLPESNWRRGSPSKRPQMDWNHLTESNWRRGSPSKRPQNIQAKWTPTSRHRPLSPSRYRYPPMSPSRSPAKAKVGGGGFKCKWSGEPPSSPPSNSDNTWVWL